MKVSSFIHLESDVMLVARFYVCGEVCCVRLWLKMYLHVRETVFNNEMKEPMMVTTQPYVKTFCCNILYNMYLPMNWIDLLAPCVV